MTPSQAELALLDATPAHAAIVDANGDVVAVNRAWRRFSAENGGASDAGLGANYCTVCRLAGDDPYARAAHDGLVEVLAGSREHFECEYPCDAPDGPRWFQLLIAPYGYGVERGAVVMHFDVTHPHRLAQALDRAQKMEAVGRMTSGLSHELNNLLQILIANLRMLERSLGRAPEQRHVLTALRSAQHAEDLMRRLLDFARHRTPAPVDVDLGEAFRTIVPLLRQVLARGTRLTVDVPAGLPRVRLDPHRLEMALLNLAINARDAMGSDGALSVSTYATERDPADGEPRALPGGTYVCIAVQDSGPGIPPQLHRHVFEPFFTTKPQDGTGLGLAMVREFARECGGDVELASSDFGTRMVLWLPVRGPVESTSVGATA